MEGVIDANATLDYAEFHIIPSQNRYEARVYYGSIRETLASGLLEQLSRHLPKVNDLYLKGSNFDFKLHSPENLGSGKWFTKSMLTSFLRIVASPDILDNTNAIENEISLLEESRKFHLSLYAKGDEDRFESGKSDGSSSIGKPEADTASSDASKNELLQAMDLRLSALRVELASALNRAAGATCSPREISDLERFSQYFGAIELRNFCCKFVEMSHTMDLPVNDTFPFKHDSESDGVPKTEGTSKTNKPLPADTPVKYGVSPAKAAQVERQSSTDGEESSHSSEEDRRSGERSSRTLIRSASPRRSASPMRRIQIGRSGSRRAPALTIKSLGYFPAREKTLAHSDETAYTSEEEEQEQPPKRKETHVRRMSVQDAISLFESKQRDQIVDTQKKSSVSDTTVSANKSVLRRWSSGVGEGSAQCPQENISEVSVQISLKSSIEVKPESDIISGSQNSVGTESVKFDTSEKESSCPITQKEESIEKLTASAEWTRQKEEELNQMMMKMMDSKPVKHQNVVADCCRNENVRSEQRGGFYNQYKEKRDEKLRGETAGKKAEKEAQFRSMQKTLNQRKAEMASANVTDAAKKTYASKPQKSNKSLSQSANTKKETSKPAITKRTPSKASPLPATRKSWPSTPPPRTTGISPAKTTGGTSSTATTPTRQKPQPAGPAPSVTRSNPKVERTQQRRKNVKPTQNDSNKNLKGINEKKKQAVPKNGKTAKPKEQTTSGDLSSTALAKPSFYSKVTKKSSVVPLESKPFLRKGAGVGPGVGPTVLKTKVSSPPEESLRTSKDLTPVIDTSDLASQQEEVVVLKAVEKCHLDLEPETPINTEQKFDDIESSDHVTSNDDDSFRRMPESDSKTVAEEQQSTISPSAWVEIEEHRDSPVHSPANIAPVATSSSRVRHSLSQMLLEESSEPDIIEWGNAENPPLMVYQKDSPKGFKRLLKFARKSRTDANVTGWSSPSAFSEGDDDAEESRSVGRKNADNLLRKSYGQQKTSFYDVYEKSSTPRELLSAQPSIGKLIAQSNAQRLQEGHASTTKATRSFFSLSAFRGSKPN